jgi:phospholipid/cholesterol/gamma-HCH transport system substrate-binding protein
MKISNEIKIALTAIAAGVLLFLGINFLKGINVFKSSNSYYVRFADAKGLTVSSKVFANGYPVGTVRDIEYNYDNNNGVVVRVELNENMSVPRGTRGELVEALMGGVTMNLLLGPNPTDHIAPFDTISGAAAATLMGDAGKMMPDVQRMLPKLDSILTNLNRLSGDPALQKTLTNAAAISENLKTTTAQLDRLMARDVPQLMAHLNRTGANAERLSGNLAKVDVQQTMDRVNATLTSAQQLSGQLNTVVGDLNQKLNSRDNNLGAFLSDRELYDRLNRTATSADSLLIDLKSHPKRYVHFSIFGRKGN